MPKCPKCKKELDGLRHYQSGTNSYDCWVEKRNEIYYMDYQHDEFTPDGQESIYVCPECDFTIAKSEEKAIEFLNG